MTPSREELLALLDKFPAFMSLDGCHWLATGEVDVVAKRAAAAIRQLEREAAELRDRLREVFEETRERCAKVCDAKIGRDCSCQVCTYLRFTATDIRNLAPQAEAKAQGDTESV